MMLLSTGQYDGMDLKSDDGPKLAAAVARGAAGTFWRLSAGVMNGLDVTDSLVGRCTIILGS